MRGRRRSDESVCVSGYRGVLSVRWTDGSVSHLPGTHTWGYASCQADVAASPDPSLPVPDMGDAEVLAERVQMFLGKANLKGLPGGGGCLGNSLT